MAEDEQSLEFYKIQVMEKDREIADFTAKTKKLEFKHNRDLKEAKIAKERAETLLRDEKAKTDKYSRAAQENSEQRQALEIRLAELKREKEREVAEVLAKYNSLKEEVRSYERILPTFTFLNELALTIPQLPNYQHIFLALRQKTSEYQQIIEQRRQAEAQWEEKLRSCKASQQILKTKRLEAEKNLKQVLVKLQEQEHQMSQLRLHNDNLTQNIFQLEEELQLARERCDSLEESIKDYENKIERLALEFQSQLASKEEEASRNQQSEMSHLQEELAYQQAQLERKEAAFAQQVRLLEEEVAYLTSKYQSEIDTFEGHFMTLKDETERMRSQITHQKSRYDELQQRFSETNITLKNTLSLQEQSQERNRLLQHKLALQEQQRARQNRAWQESERNRAQQIQKDYEEALLKLASLGQHYGRLEQQRDHLQEQNYLLREELSSAQMQRSQSNNFFLQLPRHAEQERLRKKSSEIEPVSIPSFDHRLSITETPRVKELEQELAQLQKRSEIDLKRCSQAESRVATLEAENIRLLIAAQEWRKEKQRLQSQKEKMQSQSISLKERIIQLTRANNQHQMTAFGNSTKNKLDRTKLQALQEQIRHLQQDCRRQKEAVRKLKEEIKTGKDTSIAESERLNKELKELQVQAELNRAEKEKLIQQVQVKEKSCSHQAALLKNSKQLEEVLKLQIHQLQIQYQESELALQQLNSKLTSANEEILHLRKHIEKLENSLKQAHRETELANQCLDRERKERSLLTVPSLHSIGEDSQEDTFSQIYATIPLKQGQIHLLQRQIQDLKEQMETLRLTQLAKVEAMQAENADYIQTIIEMKMRCAQSEMKASEKEHLYTQLKKRAAAYNITLK